MMIWEAHIIHAIWMPRSMINVNEIVCNAKITHKDIDRHSYDKRWFYEYYGILNGIHIFLVQCAHSQSE